MVFVLVMNFGLTGRHFCDRDRPNDDGWICGGCYLWGAEVAVNSTRHIPMDHPGKNVATGNRYQLTRLKDRGSAQLPLGENHCQ